MEWNQNIANGGLEKHEYLGEFLTHHWKFSYIFKLWLDSVGYKTHLLLRYIIVEKYQEGWYIPKSHSLFYMIPKRAKTWVHMVMELWDVEKCLFFCFSPFPSQFLTKPVSLSTWSYPMLFLRISLQCDDREWRYLLHTCVFTPSCFSLRTMYLHTIKSNLALFKIRQTSSWALWLSLSNYEFQKFFLSLK